MKKTASTDKAPIGRMIAFALALTVAIAAFSYFFTGFGRKSEGFQLIEPLPDVKAETYPAGLSLYLYAGGTSRQIKEYTNAAQSAYSAYLQRYYRLLDDKTVYEGVTNIASLNASGGKPLKTDAALTRVLADAYAKSGGAYSVFDGMAYYEWETLRYLENPQERDPLVNADTAERLALIRELSAPESCTLTFGEEGVTFKVDAAARVTATENEIYQPVLSLNTLKTAYLMQLIASSLEDAGYTNGYLTSPDGLTLTLSRTQDVEYRIYGADDARAYTALSVGLPGGAYCCRYSAYPVNGEDGYYSVNGVNRTPYVTSDGGAFLSLCLAGQTADIASALPAGSARGGEFALPDICYLTLTLLSGEASAPAENTLFCAYVRADDPARTLNVYNPNNYNINE